MVLTSPCSENVRFARYGAKTSFKDDGSLKRNMILVKSFLSAMENKLQSTPLHLDRRTHLDDSHPTTALYKPGSCFSTGPNVRSDNGLCSN